MIVPKKTVGEVRRLLEALDQESSIAVALSPSRIRFQIGTTVLVSRLIDGVFPDYERVIPQANEKIALIDARAFAVAIDRVSPLPPTRYGQSSWRSQMERSWRRR